MRPQGGHRRAQEGRDSGGRKEVGQGVLRGVRSQAWSSASRPLGQCLLSTYCVLAHLRCWDSTVSGTVMLITWSFHTGGGGSPTWK